MTSAAKWLMSFIVNHFPLTEVSSSPVASKQLTVVWESYLVSLRYAGGSTQAIARSIKLINKWIPGISLHLNQLDVPK